ncbi:serine/threonine protein kinase, partial [Streptomyces sp. MBT67]|nr:serine/threonine protein kinase [Streptomyces sp. MBT67]
MEALRQDDPRRFGRFTALARFDEGASAVRYVARDIASGETALITAARPELAAVPVFSRRFQAEARTAERLAGGWVTPPLDTGDPAETPADGAEPLWTAAGYVPALPLAEAIGIAGPLPERALRILGAGIAEILSRVHAAGSVLQGLAPGTVLLAADGPRLTAFGPLGAAASAEARPGGQLSVRLGYLTPEQIEGKEVSAASDLFVLGLLLAYGTVAAELALEGAAGLARGGWLPEPLAAAVADQEARVLALEVPAEHEQGDAPAAPGDAGAKPDPADAAAPEDARPEHPRTLREPEGARTAPEPEDARPEDAPPVTASGAPKS